MKSKSKIVIIAAAAILLNLGLHFPARAEEPKNDQAGNRGGSIETLVPSSSPSLQISPVSARIALESGQTVEKTFSVKNNGDTTFAFRVYATPYSINGENNEADFESETQHTRLSHWISFIDATGKVLTNPQYTLQPGESITVKYSIDVPEDVPSGGQYATVFAESIDENADEEGIHTISRVGLIIYANVSGDTRQEVKIRDVNLVTSLFKGNINIMADIENNGNTDFQASIDFTVQSIFGKTLYSDKLIYSIFPESTRKIFAEWDDTPFYGIFRLDYVISALGTDVQAQRYILVIPPVMLAFTVVLISVFIISLTIYIRKKKYPLID